MPSQRASRRKRVEVRPADDVEDSPVFLREHVYRITTAVEYFGAMRRIRHARYALDSLLGGSRVYGDAAGVDELLIAASAVRARFDQLEDKAPPAKPVNGKLERHLQEVEPDAFERRTFAQVELWQDAEKLLAEIYAKMAGSLEKQLLGRDGTVPELGIYVSLMRFHHGKRMDSDGPIRTYIFDLGFDEPFEVSFVDHEPQRRRNEEWYDETLNAMARYVDAARRHEESALLKKHTRIMTWLTVLIAILTAVMTVATFCR